ncbi:MAG: HAD family hydrolase [Gemmatimonadales bacterium]|nr:MAG: HAD family hydrolase [Gemmatimonadales bacterium]
MTSLVLVDFDDTLVDTAPRFLSRRNRLFDWLEDLGFAREEALSVHHDVVEQELLPVWGYGPFRLAPSFRDTYVRLCVRHGKAPSRDLARAASSLADGIEDPSPPLPGALEALEHLAARRTVAIWTQSHFPSFQWSALEAAGVLRIVSRERILIVPGKSPSSFGAALQALEPGAGSRPWMIGNSVRHDVNPALASGARAIRVRCTSEWHMDGAPPLHSGFLEAPDFQSAVRQLLSADG